jgi:hypothetical protein
MLDATYPGVRTEREQATRDMLLALFADQEFDVLQARRVLGADWDERLADAMLEANMVTGTAVGDRVADGLGGDWVPAAMAAWLTVNARLGARAINDSTRAALAKAVDREAKALAFQQLANAAPGYAQSMVTTASMLGSLDAAEASGARQKTWLARPGSQRHAKYSGVSVVLGRKFANGMKGPGDPAGGADQVANCHCSLGFD